MSRLFWKILLSFWLTLALTLVGVAAALFVYSEANEEAARRSPPAPREYAARMLVSVLRHGGDAAARDLLLNWPGREAPFVLDERGRDLAGREVPPDVLAPSAAGDVDRLRVLRRVRSADGNDYLVVLRSGDLPARPRDRRPLWPGGPNLPLFLLCAAVLASLFVSALLARHFSAPVHRLRSAFEAVSRGRLATRVSPEMGARSDEIAQLGRDFDRMAEQLQNLVGSQERLLHDVSHELRSPLARLQVAVGLARQQPERVATTLDRIEQEVGRLDALVGELLALSRMEVAPVEVSENYVDVIELVASVVDDARFEAGGSGREILFSHDVPGELVIAANGELLHRALDNVIRNALQHTPAQGAVTVSLTSDAHWVRIAVSDQGKGVALEALDSIFQPFTKAPGSRSEGYGLGLSIAQRAITAHGGRIGARNQEAGGLAVLIELPITPS